MNGEPAATQLLERDRELERLTALLADTAAGEGGLAIVEGPAGVGKTSLLLSLREQARARGLTTLSATGAQLEGAFPFGVCHQLLNEVMAGLSPAERLEVLSGAAAHARPLFGEAPEPGPAPPGGDPLFSVVHGLYWLAANLAERSPLLVLVDDAQWVDEPSLRLLDYLGRRLEGLPIGLVVALRSGEPAQEHEALGALRSQPGASLVQLSPLSDEGVAMMVRRERRSATDLFCRECAEATGGNPFYLRELLSGGTIPARGVESIARSVLDRIERLGPDAQALTSAMAVLGDGIPIRWAASLGGLEPEEAASAADALVGAEVLEVDSDRLGFAHPIVRESVYANLPVARRAADHARAAEILSDEAAPADAIASQLLHGERLGNEWAVAALRSAAEEANREGAPDVAAGYLRRALEEPPPPADRPQLLLDAGLAEMLAADPRTIEHLREALEIADEPAVRATAAAALAAVLAFLARADDAATVLRGALRTLDENEPNLRGWLRGELIVMGLVDLRAKELVAEELEVARGEEPSSSPLLAVLAYEALTGGTADEAAELADRALHEGGLLAALPIEHPSVFFSISTLIATDRREQAVHCLDAAAASAVGSGSLRAYAAVTCLRGRAGYRWGRINEAESEARTAITLIVEHDWTVGKALGAAALADALVERGELERAKEVLDLVDPAREDDDSHGFQQWRETPRPADAEPRES